MRKRHRVTSNGIYFDSSTKGDGRHHKSYRAEIRVDGRRIRKRFERYSAAREWIESWKREEDGPLLVT